MDDSAARARQITRKSSKQTYFTAQTLVDRELEQDCYRAYAYFRWVDDRIDEVDQTREDRIAFIDQQISHVDQIYNGGRPQGLTPDEEIIADLIERNPDPGSGLHSFINNFLAVIMFDAKRKGHWISGEELDWYTNTLGVSVTDCIQYFIHNGHNYPKTQRQYLAASAAHITHMLRDLVDDLSNGFINIPKEYLDQHSLLPTEIEPLAIQDWVKARVEIARSYFREGKQYIDSLKVLRCKIAAYWYCARFERLLDIIEADDYILRERYDKGSQIVAMLKMTILGVSVIFRHIFG